MGVKTPEMHPHFPRWYAAVGIGNDSKRRAARWESISAVAGKANSTVVDSLVRLTFGSRHKPSSDVLNLIHEALRARDDSFDPDEAQREIQVLAGACLQLLFDRKDHVGATAALSVSTAAFAGAPKPNLPLDLVGLGEAAIQEIAEENRRRPNLDANTNIEPPKIEFGTAAAKAKEGNWDAVAQALASSVLGALKALVAQQTKAIRSMVRVLEIQDEELQMLWWLIGGRSFDLDCAFDTVPAEAQPLVFAKELGDSTVRLPGPKCIGPLLTRAGLAKRKKVTVVAAINAMDSEWLSGLVEDLDPSPVTLPLHFGIKRQLEAGGGVSWVPNWTAVVGIDGDRPLPAVQLGLQFYRERLLAAFE
jgi:hypothetical protein